MKQEKTISVRMQGFTLIELLVVMAITAMLIAVALPNYLGARSRARDVQKKQDMNAMKQALQLYYNDYHTYPASVVSGGTGKTNYIKGCGSAGTDICPCTVSGTTIDFAVGSTCETVYMKKFPKTFGSNGIGYYFYATNSDDFCLKATLENASDTDVSASQTRCSASCNGNCSGSDYCVCAD